MCRLHLFQRRKLLLTFCNYFFVLICWIYSVFRRILVEVGFICEGFRFGVGSENVISTLTVLHLFPLALDLFLVALVPRCDLHTFLCCFPGSSSSIIREHDVQLKSKQCQLPKPGSFARISNWCSCLRTCNLLWIPLVFERCGILFCQGKKILTVACWMPLQW